MKKLIVTLLILSANADGADWYVDNAASGTNSGTTWANAWESFGDISGLSSGDVVYISGGASSAKTYEETLTTVNGVTYQVGQDTDHDYQVYINANNIRDYCIVLDPNVTISGAGSEANYGIKCDHSVDDGIHGSGDDNVTITHVEVDNAGNAIDGSCIQLGDVNGTEISYSYLHRCFQDGINSAGSTATDWGENAVHHTTILNVCDDGLGSGVGWDIYNNEIGYAMMDTDVNTHCAGASGHPDGIQLQRNYYRVWNNFIHHAATSMIFVDFIQTPSAGHVRVLNNFIFLADHENYGTTVRGIYMYADAAGVTSVTDVVIANNTIVDVYGTTGGWGIQVNARSDSSGITLTDSEVTNNIVYNCGGTSALFDAWSGTGAVFDYNIVATDGTHGTDSVQYGGSVITFDAWQSTYSQNTNGSNDSPAFFDYTFEGVTSTEDLNLGSGDTVAIDTGTPISGSNFPTSWPFDYYETARPQNSVWDIGAHEYDSGTPAPIPPYRGFAASGCSIR